MTKNNLLQGVLYSNLNNEFELCKKNVKSVQTNKKPLFFNKFEYGGIFKEDCEIKSLKICFKTINQ